MRFSTSIQPSKERQNILCNRFLLIYIKFCDLSLLHTVEGGGCSAVRKIYCTVLPHSQKTELWALEAYVHKTTYGPLIVRNVLMRANPLLGQVGGGWALFDILTVLGPKWHSPNGSMPFHRPQKVSISRAKPPSYLPS